MFSEMVTASTQATTPYILLEMLNDATRTMPGRWCIGAVDGDSFTLQFEPDAACPDAPPAYAFRITVWL